MTARPQERDIVLAALEQALDCIRGATPEDMTHEEAQADTVEKIRAALRLRAQPSPREVVLLTDAEKQSGFDRIRFAEGLIKQLPENHDGRNTWLLNYGQSEEAQALRSKRNIGWDDRTQAARSPAQKGEVG